MSQNSRRLRLTRGPPDIFSLLCSSFQETFRVAKKDIFAEIGQIRSKSDSYRIVIRSIPDYADLYYLHREKEQIHKGGKINRNRCLTSIEFFSTIPSVVTIK